MEKDYSSYLDGVKGTVVLLSEQEQKYYVYNEALSNEQASPCSSFKIISTLLALKDHVVTSTEDQMGYDNKQYQVPAWNHDLTLKEAFQSSCVWYYKKLIDKMDQAYIKKQLQQLHYGNCEISQWDGSNLNGSKDLDGFWLQSSLQISPMEQVKVMEQIFENKSCFDTSYVDIVSDLMKTVTKQGISIYGKTGTAYNTKGECVNAWYVGYAKKADNTIYFAIRLADTKRKDMSGKKAQNMITKIICEQIKAKGK